MILNNELIKISTNDNDIRVTQKCPTLKYLNI